MPDIQEVACVLKATISNPDVGDLELTDTGDAAYRSDLASAVAQRLTVRLNFFRGEWFLDTDAGTPYFQYILVKAPQDRLIRLIFSGVITKTEGVAELLRLSYAVARDRTMTVSFEARLEDGTTFRSTDYPPFVVSP